MAIRPALVSLRIPVRGGAAGLTWHMIDPSPPADRLQFLKLGGSLITDKDRPSTLRHGVLARLAGEIAAAWQAGSARPLLIGHGSGSFGHVPARKYGTRQGVRTPEAWRGFAEVWLQAATLTWQVVTALHDAGLPAISFPPSAAVIASNGRVRFWDLSALVAALENGLLPVIRGDVIFDRDQGGTILSTEALFEHLADELQPARILLAGIEPAVWADFPARQKRIEAVSAASIEAVSQSLAGSAAPDVTGGMASKVHSMLALCKRLPGLEVLIFSGVEPGLVQAALSGARPGTRISHQG